jgi:hypothetical protein
MKPNHLAKKYRAVCLISGQLRAIDPYIINKGYRLFASSFDHCDFYVDVWNEFGVSMCHDPARLKLPRPDPINIGPYLKILLQGLNVLNARVHDPKTFVNILPKKYKELSDALSQTLYRHMINQFYLIYQSSLQVTDPAKYEIVFRIRPDNLFAMPFCDSVESNEIKSINFGKIAFIKNRVYDIFFGVTSENISLFRGLFEELEANINENFDNELARVDACRLIAAQATRMNLKIGTFNYRYTDTYRGEPVEQYIETLNNWGGFNKFLAGC